jgi:hypothetical protein
VLLVCSGCVAVGIFAGLAPLMQPEKKPPAAPAAPAKQPAKPDAPAAPQPDMDAMMAMAKPGAVHQQLAKMVGEWTTSTAMKGAGMPPMDPTKGTSKIASTLGGRFFTEDQDGDMMGEPFTSAKMLGYNNGTKKYEAVWTYTGSTGMMTMTGTSKDDGKTITFDASHEEAPGKIEKMTITIKVISDDSFVVSLSSVGGAPEEQMTMETTYTRKK